MNLIKKRTFTFKEKKIKPTLKLWHKLVFLSPVFIIALLFKYSSWQKEYRLTNKGVATVATITRISFSGIRDVFDIENVEFEFFANNNKYTDYTIATTNTNYIFAGNGMPLSTGDKFRVIYYKDDPSVNECDLFQPDTKTLLSYFDKTREIIDRNNLFNLQGRTDVIFCFTKHIFKKYGIDGLATIYFHDEFLVENFKYNTSEFKNFVQKKEVQAFLRTCGNRENLP